MSSCLFQRPWLTCRSQSEWGKWAKSGCLSLFPGKLDAAANGLGNSPGNSAAAQPIPREIPREIARLPISREIGCAAAAFPGKFTREFPGCWASRGIFRGRGCAAVSFLAKLVRPGRVSKLNQSGNSGGPDVKNTNRDSYRVRIPPPKITHGVGKPGGRDVAKSQSR